MFHFFEKGELIQKQEGNAHYLGSGVDRVTKMSYLLVEI